MVRGEVVRDERPWAVVLRSFHVGVDFGQRQNHSAVVALEQRVETRGEVDRVTYEPKCRRRVGVRLVERLPLETGYDEVLRRVEALTRSEAFRGWPVSTTLDATGVGGWVVEDVRRRRFEGRTYPMVITGGERGTEKGGYWMVPRTELLQGTMLAFETRRIEIGPVGRAAELLREELLGMRRVAGAGEVRFRTAGKQDDLVFALALAWWGAGQKVLPVRGEEVRRRVR